MPKDQVLLLDSQSQTTIEARVVLADGTTAQVRIWTDTAVGGGRIYRSHGEGICARNIMLGEIVPHADGILQPRGILAPDWQARLPDALRAVLAVPPAEPAPEARRIRVTADRHGVRRIGPLEALSDLDDAPTTEILLRPDGRLAAREWEPQRRVPTEEPGVMAVRDAWTPWVEARIPDQEAKEIRSARGPDRGILLEDGYWAHLNDKMEDPLLMEEDPWLAGSPFTVRGGQDLLDELLTLAAWADPETAASLPGTLAVIAARPDVAGSTATLCPAESSVTIGAGLAAHAAAILARLEPSGTCVSYNDGAGRRRSGYDVTEVLHTIDIPAASAHERLEAAQHLAAWMARHAPEPR